MASSNLAIPAAIVASSVILATGVYLGLRAQGPAPSPASPPGPAAPPVAAPPIVAPPPAVKTPEIEARGLENARRALEGARAEFVRRCWTPAADKQPEPRRLPLVFNLSFSPDGVLLGWGLSEDRAVQRPEVANCLRAVDLTLRIPAPGVPLQLAVPLTLP